MLLVIIIIMNIMNIIIIITTSNTHFCCANYTEKKCTCITNVHSHSNSNTL